MGIPETIKKIIEEEGRTQAWVTKEMNKIDPQLQMSQVKFSAIICKIRRMTGEELLAFCKAMKVNPDVFLEEKKAG